MRSVSPALVSAVPRSIVSLSFRVTNNTDRQEEFIETLQLPTDWRLVVPPSSFTLNPAESLVRITALQVPGNTPAGRYELSYSVRSQRDYAIQDISSLTVVVQAVSKLALQLEAKPDSAIAGQSYRIQVRVMNHGNAPLNVTLSLESNQQTCRAQIEPSRLALPAGGSQLVTVTVSSDARGMRSFPQIIQVKAQGDTGTAQQASASLSASVDIIPRASGKPDLFQEIPTELLLRANGDEGGTGLLAMWRGTGALDESGTRRIDFLLQGPDTQDRGIFGWRDEYRINYFSKGLDVRLGDQNYSLSPLTDLYHYGRGMGLTIRDTAQSELGIHYLRNRWQEPRNDRWGLYRSLRFNDAFRVQFNLLSKNEYLSREVTSANDQLWSVEGTLRPTADMNLQLEYGKSDSDRPGTVSDDAYRFELNGRAARSTYYTFRKTRAGPDYYGYYHDAEYTTASITRPFSGRLQGTASYSIWKQNLDLRPYQATAPEENLAQFHLHYTFPANWFVSLGYDEFHRRDLLLPTDYDSQERGVRLALGRSAGKCNWNFQFRGGRQEDVLAQQTSHVLDYQLFASYQSTRQQSFTLYGGYSAADRESRLLGASNYLGGSFIWRPAENISLTAWYTSNNFSNEGSKSNQFDLTTRYTLSNGCAWNLQWRRYNPNTVDRGTSYSLSYSVPLGIPVSKKTSVGAVCGRVYDSREANKPGIADVVLTLNGAAVVTNGQGRFDFPVLPPGTYSLNVDRKSIGLNRITEIETPVSVAIKGGEIMKLNLGVIPSATLSGSVVVVQAIPNGNGTSNNGGSDEMYVIGDPKAKITTRNGNGTSNNGNSHTPQNPQNTSTPGEGLGQSKQQGLANILVELSNGKEVLRRATDSSGEFVFESLRPGKWQLKVYDANLPEYHYLETSTMDIELHSGETAEVAIRVLPRLRRIRMIGDSGEREVTVVR